MTNVFTVGEARPRRSRRALRRGDGRRMPRGDDRPLRAADALLHRRDPGRHLLVRGLASTTTASSTSRFPIALTHDGRRATRCISTSPARRRRRAGRCNISRNTTLSTCLRRAEAHLPGRAGQRRHLPAAHASPSRTARMLAAEYPTPVGAYLEPVGRILDLIFGALAQAIPDRVPAAFFGTVGRRARSAARIRARNSLLRRRVSLSRRLRRARARATASSTATRRSRWRTSCRSSCREHRFPLRFDYFALREDSGGAGWHRGGCGTTYALHRLVRHASSRCLGDRATTRPSGSPAAVRPRRALVEFRTDGQTWTPELGGKQEKQLAARRRRRPTSPRPAAAASAIR